MTKDIVSISIHDLILHPLHDEIYGAKDPKEMAELVADIAANGMLQPLIVDQDYQVISGSRRLAAAIELDMEDVPCERVAFNDEAQRIQWLISHNAYRTKSTAVRVREARILESMYAVVAKANQAHRELEDDEVIEGIARGEGKVVVRDKASEAVGLKPRTYQDAKTTLEIADKLRAEGKTEEADQIEAKLNESVAGAKALASKYKEPKEPDPQAILYWYKPYVENVVSIMQRKVAMMRKRTDSTTPVALSHFLNNVEAMADRMKTWYPAQMKDCPVCQGTMFKEGTACTNCIQGKVGMYVEAPPKEK